MSSSASLYLCNPCLNDSKPRGNSEPRVWTKSYKKPLNWNDVETPQKPIRSRLTLSSLPHGNFITEMSMKQDEFVREISRISKTKLNDLRRKKMRWKRNLAAWKPNNPSHSQVGSECI